MKKIYFPLNEEHVAGYPSCKACKAGAEELAMNCDAREETCILRFLCDIDGGFDAFGDDCAAKRRVVGDGWEWERGQ